MLGVHGNFNPGSRKPADMRCCHEGFDVFVTSAADPLATGWSDPVSVEVDHHDCGFQRRCRKSTLIAQLAAWLHEQGCRVTLADCDTQQSSSEWIREAIPGVKAVRLDNPDVILNELPSLSQDADFVVADGPGSQTQTSRALLLRADLAIVPCKASMLEIRALAKATEVLRQAQDIRKGVPTSRPCRQAPETACCESAFRSS